MGVQIFRMMIVLALLLVISACSNEKEAQNTIEATQTETFMVMAGMDCCPPSVVEDAVAQVEGAGKTAIKVTGSTAEVTVAFDDTKTNLDAIKTAVSELGLPVE